MSAAVLGVDLGGTKIALAVKQGNELGRSELEPTCLSSASELIDQLVALIDEHKPEGLEAVGVGVPSIVEFGTGRVVSSANIPLRDVALRQELEQRLGVPTFVDNDATVAALAEAHDENLRMVARDLVMITVGTGIGGGLVLGGRIYRGSTGGAGELGHTVVALDMREGVGEPEGFPAPGSLENEASGHALDRLTGEAAEGDPDGALGSLAAKGGEVLGAEAVEAARDGDPTAQRIVRIWGERLGVGIANAINTFDPEEVVIGGGAAQAGDLLLEPARRVAQAWTLPGLGTRTSIRPARHGVRAGVLGAALLAEHELESAGSEARGQAQPAEEVSS